ncbi:MAG: hypothetical protein RBR77_04210 [Thauera sp.]|jgi:hypothetical protein|nr:hypothetical protein [Thauera sp.]
MGKARIISDRGNGLYLVRREYEDTRYQAQVAFLEQRINELNASEDDLNRAIGERGEALEAASEALSEAQKALVEADQMNNGDEMKAFEAALMTMNAIAGEIEGMRKQKDRVIADRMSAQQRLDMLMSADERPQELAWCADLSEGVQGEVGTIELPGEPQRYDVPVENAGDPVAVTMLIKPQDTQPGYKPDRDGVLMPREWMTPEQAFFNAAILPGWQRWLPMYRAGKIQTINETADTCSVQVTAPANSTAESLPVNQVAILHDVPAEYMNCGMTAFEEGDDVVVEFPERTWSSAKIIGFLHHPKPCKTGRFVWMPEGFHLFPRNDEAPKGWGLPITDGQPTAGGPLPFVLVNRKRDNNYPDVLAGRSHRPVGLGYLPSDDAEDGPFGRIGVKTRREEEVEPQFYLRWSADISEPDSDRWYAHWAEPAKLTPIQQGILDRTNEFRAEENQDPLYPALRGVYAGPADAVLQQMQKHQAQVHEYAKFDDGYRMFDDRVFDRYGNIRITASSEILATAQDIVGEAPYQTGRRLADIWKTSPKHYAAMVANYSGMYGDLEYVGFAHIAAGRGTTAWFEDVNDGNQVKPVEPPVIGTQGAQVFYGTDRLLAVFNAYWRGDAGTVSWYAPTACRYGYIHLDFEVTPENWANWCGRRSNVAISGRLKAVHDRDEPATDRAVISAALCFVGEDLRLRVCTLNADHLIQLWDGPAWSNWSEFSVLATLDPTAEYDNAEGAITVGYPIFSETGSKCVIPLTRRIFHTGPALRQNQVNFGATDGDAMVVGSVIDFYEFSGASFSHVHRSRMDVVPVTISTTTGRNEYVEACSGEYRWLADYDRDTLVYATVELNNRVEQWAEYSFGDDFITIERPEVSAQSTYVRISQTLKFPSGAELVTADCEITDWRASGFVLCLHTLDIRHPEMTAYSRQTLGNLPDDRPTVALQLEWNGAVQKQQNESVPGASGPPMPPAIWRDGCAWGGGIARMQAWSVTQSGSLTYFAYAHPRGLSYSTPGAGFPSAGALPAQVWGDCVKDAYPGSIGAFSNVNRGFVHSATSIAPALSPMLVIRVYDDDATQADLSMWEYGGEWVLSGYYVNPVLEFPTHGFWEPSTDRRLWRATFDLEGAVGRRLGNNIEPVGVV